MYNPPHFREDRLDVLHGLIREHPFATLVTTGPDGLGADHIPMEIDASVGPFGTLVGHVSRANPLWKLAASGAQVLAIFQGPQMYITPSWYATKRENGKVVPTWNYAVVHAHGPLRAIEDRDWLRAFVERLTNRHEDPRAEPWRVSDAPDDFVEGLLKGIVGVEVPIARIEGKWKVSQNRPGTDRAGVVAGLEASGDADHAAMARLVRERPAPWEPRTS